MRRRPELKWLLLVRVLAVLLLLLLSWEATTRTHRQVAAARVVDQTRTCSEGIAQCPHYPAWL